MNPIFHPASEECFLLPVALVFDDEPIGPVVPPKSVQAPTPAGALDLWQKDLDRSDSVARAVVSIISRDPSHLKDLAGLDILEHPLRKALECPDTTECGLGSNRGACLTALGALARTRGRLEEAEKSYRSAYELQKTTLGAGHQETQWTTERLAQLLEQTGREAEAERLRRVLAVDQILEGGGSLELLRTKALELFLSGQCAEAEAAYRHLLNQGFELPSTHCHIARICLMTNRDSEAASETALAWDARQGAPGYMPPRILFLRMLCELLAKRQVEGWLQKISRSLNEPGAFAEWAMQPVIEHLKPRLPENIFVLLTVLLDALSDPAKMRELRNLPEWLAATNNSDDNIDSQHPSAITGINT